MFLCCFLPMMLMADPGDAPVARCDLDAFAGPLLMLEYKDPNVRLCIYVARLECRRWQAKGFEAQYDAELWRAKEAWKAWSILSSARYYAKECSLKPELCVERLNALHGQLGEAAFYAGRMPDLPEGIWYLDEEVPLDPRAEPMRRPTPQRPVEMK